MIVCELAKEQCFLQLRFIDFDSEANHLSSFLPEDGHGPNHERMDQVASMLASGRTYEEISQAYGISKGTISKWKKKYPERFVSVSTVSEPPSFGNMETGNADHGNKPVFSDFPPSERPETGSWRWNGELGAVYDQICE